nr:immunoglobulin heavy chain junction region [Mus musculus]MBK4195837.1 immunoglobulin heavy chain junction region [Mus musculus]
CARHYYGSSYAMDSW